MTRLSLAIFYCLVLAFFQANAQCTTGEVEVTIEVETDQYGYEVYWELLPNGNACGNASIFTGGNSAVGCNGGGAQAQTLGGYGNNATITEGPWCLLEDEDYDIRHIDDWADGGTHFTVNVEGWPVQTYETTTSGEVFTFAATQPPALDLAMLDVHTPVYVTMGDVEVDVEVLNRGTTAITSVELNYTIDGGNTITATVGGLNIQPFDEEHLSHTTVWTPAAPGEYDVVVWFSDINGQGVDEAPNNDQVTGIITVNEPIPNIIPSYTSSGASYTIEEVGSSTDQVDNPTDLDFHPNGQLWITNFGTENSGGSTVTFTDPGEGSQSSEWLQDGNAWHFMSLPSALAFSENGNFATSTAVFDANHNGGQPFTGPALWSSDPAIYAQPSGGNGSHLDMLHESPHCMGIASDHENVFWVMDAYNNDIVMYDFASDHGPGNSDHTDGRVLRYQGMSVDWINQNIPSHLILQKETGWLYIVDGGNQRILRMDINSGTVGGTPSFGPFETLAEHANVTGVTWEEVVTTGLDQPCGIDIIDNQMVVSDYATGDIIFYDLSSMPATEEARISTNPGITGVKIGPNGHVWYTNKTESTVNKVVPGSIISGAEIAGLNTGLVLRLYPNPAAEQTLLKHGGFDRRTATVAVFDAVGQTVLMERLMDGAHAVDVSQLAPGVYTVAVADQFFRKTERLVVR